MGKKKKLPLLQGISFLRPEGWIGGLTVCWILRGLFASWCRVPDSARAALQEAIENSLTSSLKVTRLRRNGIKSVKGQILCFSITGVRVEVVLEGYFRRSPIADFIIEVPTEVIELDAVFSSSLNGKYIL